MRIDDIRAAAQEETARQIDGAYAAGLRAGEERANARLSERLAKELPKLIEMLLMPDNEAPTPVEPAKSVPHVIVKSDQTPGDDAHPGSVEPSAGPTERIRKAICELTHDGKTTTFIPRIRDFANRGVAAGNELTDMQIRTALKGMVKSGELLRVNRGEYRVSTSATPIARRGRPENGTNYQFGVEADMRST